MKTYILSAAKALVFALLSNVAHAGLVTNGDFETGNLSGWTLVGDPSVNFVNTGFTHSGTYALWMGEIGSLASLSQTLNTVVGAEYNLTFWFAGDGDNPSQFQAIVGSTTLFDVVNPPFDLNYVQHSFNFTATSSATLLQFKFRDDDFFMNLDDVDVTQVAAAVPEPVSLALLGLGLVGLVAVRKRKA